MLVAQSCPILHDPMDSNPPGFSAHVISLARMLEWVAIPPLEDLPDPGIEPGSPALQEDSLPSEPTGKPKDPLRRFLGHTLCGHNVYCGHKSVGILHCALKCRFLGTLLRNADRESLRLFPSIFIQLNWQFPGAWPGSHKERRILCSAHSWQCLFSSDEISNRLPAVPLRPPHTHLHPRIANSVPKRLALSGKEPNHLMQTCVLQLAT